MSSSVVTETKSTLKIRFNQENWFQDRMKRFSNSAHQLIENSPSILSSAQIKRIKEHRYASEGSTILDPLLQKFWARLVEFCPRWVAPNLITLLGLLVNIFTSLLILISSDGGKEESNRTIYFLAAFGIFFYQSLDAIDGKQARRTNSSTPLGELFDHGCDSVSTVFVSVACASAIQLGDRPWLMFLCCMASYFTFYCAHWQTYVSGKLRFAKFDCTEAQVAFIGTYLISAICPSFWSKTLPVFNLEFRLLISLMVLFSAVWNSSNNIYKLLQGGCGLNLSTIAGTSIIFPIWPIGFLIFLAYSASSFGGSRILVEHTALHLIFYGISFSKITNRLIVAHMSKSALNSWDTAYIGPLAICINQYFNIWISEHILMWIFLLFGLYDLLRYNVKVCQELCGSLNISCFRIEPSDGPVSNINQ